MILDQFLKNVIYQNLLNLNNIIEKKFQKNVKIINEKTKENILRITSKKNAKKTK